MRVKRKYLLIILPLALLWIGALCYASVYDLEISQAVADRSSSFGRMLEIWGEPPAILFAAFNFTVLTAYQLRCTEYSSKNKLFAALFSVMAVGLTLYTHINTINYSVNLLDESGAIFRIDLAVYILFAFCALLVIGLFALIAFTMSNKTLRKIVRIAGSCTVAAVATFFVIWAFKLCWGRIRFRDITDAAQFTPWYLPMGFTGGFSFPSGHTANATVIVSAVHYLSLLPKRLRFVKIAVCVLLGAWIPTVAFSRVVAGAHYLSDVLFGMAITFAIVYFSRPRKTE